FLARPKYTTEGSVELFSLMLMCAHLYSILIVIFVAYAHICILLSLHVCIHVCVVCVCVCVCVCVYVCVCAYYWNREASKITMTTRILVDVSDIMVTSEERCPALIQTDMNPKDKQAM